MKFYYRLVQVLSISLFLCLVAASASATNLRGQVVRRDPYNGSAFPLGGVRVDIWFYNGYQWFNGGYTFTDNGGFYYFGNVAPGSYVQFQVFGNFFNAVNVMNVYPPYFQDVPWIVT